jgi:hypothetical protein
VEERVITKDGKPQRVEVPVEMPDGVSREHVSGCLEMIAKLQSFPAVLMRKNTVGNGYGAGVGAGVGAGSAGGIGGGSYAANAASPSVSVFSATVKSRGKDPPPGESRASSHWRTRGTGVQAPPRNNQSFRLLEKIRRAMPNGARR